MISRNPFNSSKIKSYQHSTDKEILQLIKLSDTAYYNEWKNINIEERVVHLDSIISNLKKYSGVYSLLVTNEMGKTIKESIAEIEKCILLCEYYKENAAFFLEDEVLLNDKNDKIIMMYEPLGVILGIMPWNFPFWQVFRFVIPTILAGNTVVVKHSSNVTGCLLAIDNIFKKSTFPNNIFNAIITKSEKVKDVIRNPRIKAISLTGSESAGMDVASLSGKLIKKNVLELGGSDPFIVFKDVDIIKAVNKGVKSRMLNTGQSCIAAKRFIVHKSIINEFIKNIEKKVSKLVIGNPSDPNTDIGPLARNDIRLELHNLVTNSIQLGAKLICGGNFIEGDGFYYQPTILTNIKKNMPVFYKEVFGPVFVIMSFSTDNEAIQLANDSNYGLGASIWCNDIKRAADISKQLECGMVTINDMMKSDPRLPFGGVKLSGYGRELSSLGIKEFVNTKTINIKGVSL